MKGRRTDMPKRIIALLIVAISLVGVNIAGAQGGTKPQIPAELPDLKGREVVAVTAQDYTPLTFVDTKTNKGVGMEIEVWDEICVRLNWEGRGLGRHDRRHQPEAV
jgi:hypothetical protein